MGRLFIRRRICFKQMKQEHLYVGSSNLSRSALSSGVEWNVSISDEEEVFAEGLRLFLETFLADQTIPLNEETLKEYRKRYDAFHVKTPNIRENMDGD